MWGGGGPCSPVPCAGKRHGVADPDLDPVELYDAAAASGAAAGAAAEDLAMSPASADEDGESVSEATTEG